MKESSKNFKIAFLIIDYVPHQITSIKSFIDFQNAEILSFNVGRFVTEVPTLENFTNFHYKEFKKEEILQKVLEFNPDCVVVAGWMIKEYVWVSKQIKKLLKIPVVALSDTQWNGTIKQKINVIISPFYLKKVFTHVWVAGIYQYEYARKLGFDKNHILFNSLSADVDLFDKAAIAQKKINYPKKLLYIGRFSPEKGLDKLLTAWSKIEDKQGWSLTLVGKGDIPLKFNNNDNVIIKDYMESEDLVLELEKSGCFILPSNYEPWALVLHEAAAAGLPIIATEVCGAVPYFVSHGYNGFVTETNTESLKSAIQQILSFDIDTLYKMGERSKNMSKYITSYKSTLSLMKILE